jgi:hypothetical protein
MTSWWKRRREGATDAVILRRPLEARASKDVLPRTVPLEAGREIARAHVRQRPLGIQGRAGERIDQGAGEVGRMGLPWRQHAALN